MRTASFLFILVLAACSSQRAESSASNADAAVDTAPDAAPADGGCATNVPAIAPSASDPYAYPPYALDGCTLLYVAADGALHRRDLASVFDEILDTDSPRRPTIAGDVMAWESTVGGASAVRVRAGGKTITLPSPSGEPSAARDGVAFTSFAVDADVMLYVPSSGETLVVADGPGEQRFADVSDAWVAYTDFSEDPSGKYSGESTTLADIGVYARASKSRTLRHKPGKQAFPILAGGDALVYLDWEGIRPQPKLEGYGVFRAIVGADVSLDASLATIQTQPPYVRPSGRGGVVSWVVRDFSNASLFAMHVPTASGAADPTGAPVSVISAVDLFAPVTLGARTLIAVRSEAAGMATLRIVGP